MESNNTIKDEIQSKKILNKSDITKLAIRSSYLQMGFNYERMQSPGFTMSQMPLLKRIYKDDPEAYKKACFDNMEFINTHPNFAGFLMGLLISLEESGEKRETIKGIKLSLYAPLAGIGDAFFWFTLLPIMAGITSSLAIGGSILGPIIFFLVYLSVWILRIPLTHLGYDLGAKSIPLLAKYSNRVAKSASIVGITVIGGLIGTYVHLSLAVAIPINDTKTVNLQTDFLDHIFPNILAAAYTGLLYYLLKKKNVSPVALIVGSFVVVLVLSALGIL